MAQPRKTIKAAVTELTPEDNVTTIHTLIEETSSGTPAPAISDTQPASIESSENAGKNKTCEQYIPPKPYEPVDLPYKIHNMDGTMVMQSHESCRYSPEIELQLLESHHTITLHGKRISKKSVEALLSDHTDS